MAYMTKEDALRIPFTTKGLAIEIRSQKKENWVSVLKNLKEISINKESKRMIDWVLYIKQ